MNASQSDAKLAAIMANGTKAKFDIGTCLTTVQALQTAFPDAGLTFRLNLTQCYQYCGRGIGPYQFWDVADALSTWVFPLFNLLGNIGFTATTKFGTQWYKAGGNINLVAIIAHLLADPIDAIWGLATKLDVGRRIQRRCRELSLDRMILTQEDKRDIATVCYALDDFGPERLQGHFTTLCNLLSDSDSRIRRDTLTAIKVASYDLALARLNNTLHSSLAVILYCVAVFGALVRTKSTGDEAYHQPHTIALREIYYWLLLLTVLSSAAGKWPSQWTPHAILNRLGNKLGAFHLDEMEPWNGGNYSWQPGNNIFCRGSTKAWSIYNPLTWAIWYPKRFYVCPEAERGDRRHLLLLFTAFLSVAIAWTISFLISWYTPTVGLGGRGICEIVFILVWLCNFIHSQWWGTQFSGRKLFHMVWIKDGAISFAMLFVLFAAFQGWYNSCISWSAYFSRGAQGTYLDLQMKSTEVHLTFIYYFEMILTALLVQFALAAFLLGLNRDALTLTERSNEENLQALETYSGSEDEGMTTAFPGTRQLVQPSPAVLVESAPGQASGMELGTMTSRHRPSHQEPSPGQDPLDLGAVVMKLSPSGGHSDEYEQRESNDSDDKLGPYGAAQPLSGNLSERLDSAFNITRRPALTAFDSQSSQRPLLPPEDPA